MFQFKLTILIFWTKFFQKGYSQSKTNKKDQIWDQICPKREFPVENEKIALVRASMVVTY